MSGSVFVSNLDDFIAPSQACVNPLVASKLEAVPASAPEASIGGNARLTLSNDFSRSDFDETLVKPNLIRGTPSSSGERKVASVSLNDCLACSGCVTSAETMLIQQQSYDRLLDMLCSVKKLRASGEAAPDVVVAISPNSIASIANYAGVSKKDFFLRCAAALKSMGVRYVFDASAGGDVALIEACEEFVQRYREGRRKGWTSPPTTTALSADSINAFSTSASGAPDVTSHDVPISLQEQIPVLSSHCPGFVCFAEKSHPQALPFLSTVKSAQQIVGASVKDMSARHNTEVFFVSVQPCFDKKLEASRLDFYHQDTNRTDVDLVLSTTELWQLLEAKANERKASPVAAASLDLDDIAINTENSSNSNAAAACCGGHNVSVMEYLASLSPDAPQGSDSVEAIFRSYSADGLAMVQAVDSNAGSGGYAEYIFKYAAQKLFGLDLQHLRGLPFKEGRNSDITEVDINDLVSTVNGGGNAALLADGTSAPRKLKFARAYGFRNIQSLMLKLRRGTCDFDYVEMMACPSGCNNGGGQIRAQSTSDGDAGTNDSEGGVSMSKIETPAQSRERVKQVEGVFHEDLVVRRPGESALAQYLYSADVLLHPLSPASILLLHTRYHAVPKLEFIAPLATKW
ncbi:iron hydrogenase [Ochromonadaceae sp. CCMP2298]|nr:iron hydrogenase [Ochromonadaceae sp. CCMP2298]|mmetsp:Transcript_4355/g.9772  ORF Transcript_4355/g.9772 Transcript_4355/m.9772 type:complete len:630 (-) Transcript_4355:77-1966(-)